MKRVWARSAKVLAGVVLGALYAMPQAYTISARPGVVNYIEGSAYINGHRLSESALKSAFLNANDTLSTDVGKAEVLLTPGVFLRIGDNSQIRMISPSLTNTQVEVSRGEAMIEAAGLIKDNNVQIIDHGGSITIEKNGLYRITGDAPPAAAVIDGKAEVYFGEKKVDLGKGHEVLLADGLKEQKFDAKKEDDLYAWSNVRSEYEAAASYQAAKSVTTNDFGGWGGYGFGGWYTPGWFWNNGFNSYAWLPGNGAFFSPFGYGFYGPGLIPYAPVVIAPVYRGGTLRNGYLPGRTATTASVPVNPNNPPAVGSAVRSPWSNRVARTQVAQSFANSGFRTAGGNHVAVGGWSGNGAHSGAHSGWSGGGAHTGAFTGGGGHAGGFAGGAGGGGAHVSGGGGGHK